MVRVIGRLSRVYVSLSICGRRLSAVNTQSSINRVVSGITSFVNETSLSQ